LVIEEPVNKIAASFSTDDRRKLSDHLKSKEQRTYLWLLLTFDIIEQGPSEYGRWCDIEELLSQVPPEVSDAYKKILSRSKNDKRMEILLQIIFAATRPLTLEEANIALTLALLEEPTTSHTMLGSRLWPRDKFRSIVTNLCGLLISVNDSKLSFVHQKARKFLMDQKRRGVWQGRFSISKSHSRMALLWLGYLLLPDLRALLEYPNVKKILLPYTAEHWCFHHALKEDAAADQSRQAARRVCNVAGSRRDFGC
jgi:hypothetical protein